MERRSRSRRHSAHTAAGRSLPILLVLVGVLALGSQLGACGGDDEGGSGPNDTKAPTVMAISPSDGLDGVSLNSDVEVTFSESVEPTTCTASTFTMDNGVTGTVTVDGSTVTFTPSAMLSAETEYEFTVTTGVEDKAGNALAQPFTSSFTTSGIPVADPGDDLLVNRGQTVALDASHSSGTSGGVLTYTWTQIAGPVMPVLSGATPSFTAPDHITTIVYSLVVTDDGVDSDPARVSIMVMENKDHAFFVHPTGSDENDGGIDAPFVTIQAAIDAALAENGGGDVYIAGGSYPETLTLRTDISLYGGYAPEDWRRDQPFAQTVVRGGTKAVIGVDADDLTIDGLIIESADGSEFGECSIGLVLSSCTGVTVSNNHIKPGNGMVGLPGTDGRDGLPGAPGGNGSGRGGGNGGAGPGHSGGSGGTGGFDWESGGRGSVGSPPPPAGGAAGGGGGDNGRGGVGGDGSNALLGSDGPGGLAFGHWDGDVYVPARGTQGQQNHGCGGGGGGGGGGGAGGEGGEGGEGGQGGGASIGIVLADGSDAVIENTTITTANGGRGGFGGEGGEGAPGGPGGGSGTPQNDGIGWLEGEYGGRGGIGGAGAKGGFGGGGGGGPVVGIYSYQSTSTRSALVYELGTPGEGGARQDETGIDGMVGESAEYKSEI